MKQEPQVKEPNEVERYCSPEYMSSVRHHWCANYKTLEEVYNKYDKLSWLIFLWRHANPSWTFPEYDIGNYFVYIARETPAPKKTRLYDHMSPDLRELLATGEDFWKKDTKELYLRAAELQLPRFADTVGLSRWQLIALGHVRMALAIHTGGILDEPAHEYFRTNKAVKWQADEFRKRFPNPYGNPDTVKMVLPPIETT